MAENNQKKSTGRGGARPGAGRKLGAATQKTRAIADKALAEGISPLEVMLMAMKALVAQAKKRAPKGVSAADAARNRVASLVAASEVAKDAAPYMHPRLSAIEHAGKVTVRSLAEEMAELNGAFTDAEGDPSLA